MPHNQKVPPDVKVEFIEKYLLGKISALEAATKLNVHKNTFLKWVISYKVNGPSAFVLKEKNNVYSPELKMTAVMDYLSGGSLKYTAAKYGLRSSTQLRRWVKMYNEGKDFVHKMSGGSQMTTSRKTTKDERIKIVKECLESGKNYGQIANKYCVSYQQVYQWTNKFIELGEAGLEDRRGKRKADQKPRSELEEMQIKMAQLEHELYMTRMERDLLKKLGEVERRDASRK